MEIKMVAILAALMMDAAAVEAGSFSPGRGFKPHAEHGGMGFPPLPSRLGFPTYNTSRSTAAYFPATTLGSTRRLSFEHKPSLALSV